MKLTQAERENCRLLADDKSIKEVAGIRGVSPNTVKVQVNSAKQKLNVGTIQGLTAKFVTGLLLLLGLLTAMLITLNYQTRTEISFVPQITNIETLNL